MPPVKNDYTAPEYITKGCLTTKSDVYSFGIILLELLSGLRVLDNNRPMKDQNLVIWAKPYLRNKIKLLQIVDSRLEGQYPRDAAYKIGKLALQCLSSDPKQRPMMGEVVHVLEHIQCLNTEVNMSRVSLGSRYFQNPRKPFSPTDVDGQMVQGGSSNWSMLVTPPQNEGEILETGCLKSFRFNDLRIATGNFRPDFMLADGGFGCVFKGWIDEHTLKAAKAGTGIIIVIKRLNQGLELQGPKEWLEEIIYLGRLYHPNLVKLVGYCLEDVHRFLVYEFMPYGSLKNHLFSRSSYFQPLSWNLRMKVALGAANGLAFLHRHFRKVMYRQFKSSNILLDRYYNAKLSDFVLDVNRQPDGRRIASYGYAAPEYIATGQLTSKNDVYCFGVVLLEMLTGRCVTDTNRPHAEQNLVEWARPYLASKKSVIRVMDARIKGQYTLSGALKAATLALKCIAIEPKNRPKMDEVVKALEQLQDR